MNTKIGFVLGKFMPCHKGHKFLFDCAASCVDKLYILMCSRDCEPVNGYLRYQWVNELAPKNAVVIHMHKDIPQEPSESPDFWNIWKKAIHDYIPEKITHVFGSEDYIIPLAKILNSKPNIIDINRSNIKICATNIRSNPKKYWDFIPDNVKIYYQNRICILGPQSTGKSTLCELINLKLGYDKVDEYGRDYDAIYKQGKNWSDEDFTSIATIHYCIQQQVSRLGTHCIIEDTDIIQTLVWSEFLLGYMPLELINKFHSFKKADLYLLLTPETKWIDDGTRYSESDNQRDSFYESLKMKLDFFKLNYRIIKSDNYDIRSEQVTNAILEYYESN